MNRMTTAIVMSALLIGGQAFAQTPPTLPPVQTPPKPAPQTPPATAPKPAAQTPPVLPPPPVPFPVGAKFAFVNLQVVSAESLVGKAATTEMNVAREKRDAELQSLNVQLKALQDRQANSSLLNDAAKNQVAKDIERLTMDMQYKQQVRDKELTDKNNDLINDFYAKVIPIIEAIAKEKDLDAVFSGQDSGALYARPGLDISLEVVKRLDAAHKGKSSNP